MKIEPRTFTLPSGEVLTVRSLCADDAEALNAFRYATYSETYFMARYPEEGANLTVPEVVAFCRQKLASFKVPRLIEFREELPKTMVGKVLRRILREEELHKSDTEQDKEQLVPEDTSKEEVSAPEAGIGEKEAKTQGEPEKTDGNA